MRHGSRLGEGLAALAIVFITGVAQAWGFGQAVTVTPNTGLTSPA